MFESGFQELLDEFLLEARERADQVETLLLQLTSGSDKERSSALAQAKRELHTLKGNSGMMGLTPIEQLSHRLEDACAHVTECAEDLRRFLVNRLTTVLRQPFTCGDFQTSSRDCAGRDLLEQKQTAVFKTSSG